MGNREARRRRRLMRGAIEMDTKAKVAMMFEKFKRRQAREFFELLTIAVLVPANVWALVELIKGVRW